LGNIKIKIKLKGLFFKYIFLRVGLPLGGFKLSLFIYLIILGLVGLLRVGGFLMEALAPSAFATPPVFSLGMVFWVHA
jgi:hypothetical protein